jgi:beta-N-acetylhexosaminidase
MPCAAALLIAVDHEGGRVQRFREGFTRCRDGALGRLWDQKPDAALTAAATRWATFWPRTALARRRLFFHSGARPRLWPVAGDRRSRLPSSAERRHSLWPKRLGDGLREGGMGSAASIIPGHGYVIPDSHVELPVDDRSLEAMQEDLIPYRRFLSMGHGRPRYLQLHGLQYCCIFK